MKFLWSFLARRNAPQPVQSTDAKLTCTAASLLRVVECEDLAARVAVTWNNRLSSTAGLARPERALVLLNPRLKTFPVELERTLRHELAHLVAYARARGRRIAPHGTEWRQACIDLGISGESRCHTLPLPRRKMLRRYVYRCPKCNFLLRRTRPIKTRRRLACLDCCKRHARGKFDARFEFIRLRHEAASSCSAAESMVQQTLKL